MNYELDFLPGVEKEIIEASQWYENRKEGLGMDFLLSVEAGLFSAQRQLLSFQKVIINVRRVVIKGFLTEYFLFSIMKRSLLSQSSTYTAIR